jgi:hypothetical protein
VIELVPSTIFHRLDATAIGLVDSAFDTLSGLRCRLVVVLVGESVEHHCSGQYHRSRVGLALAHDIGGRAVTRLEYRVLVADIGRRRDAKAADQSGGEIR